MTRKQSGSLTTRIETYFLHNREEWLLMADMEVKFQADAEQIKNAIERLRANGRINIRPITVYAFAGDVS